jgi:hypothetical protein
LPDCTYTPDPDYNGPDSFSFRASDGYQESENGTVTITVNPLNDPPTITGATLLTDEDQTSAGFTPWVVDADPVDSYTCSILTQPFSGNAYISSNQLVYDPEPNFNGNDFFTFRTRDSGGEFVDGTAIVTVSPINDPPISTTASITTSENTTSQGVTPTVVDIDNGESFTFSVLIQSSQGTAYALSDQLYYTPNPSVNGTDSFVYRAFDSGNAFVDGTATVTIGGLNDPPVANSQSVIANEDIPTPVVLTASDIDGDALIFAIVTPPAFGTLTGTPPEVTYLSNQDYNGADSFTFKANDGSVDSNIATVTITVNPVNDPPTSTSATIITSENTPSQGVTPTVVDVDSGESFTFSVLTQPAKGTASVAASQLYYQPNPSVTGTDSFTYRAFDSASAFVDGVASVTISGVNDPPVADSQAVIADEDVALPIVLTGSDIDGDALIFAIVTPPAFGSLSGTPPEVTYLSNLNYNGADSFTFRVNDGLLDSEIATVSITINAVNDPPTATSADIVTDEDTASAGVTPSVLDVDTVDAYTYSILTQPASGTASVVANQLVYEPLPDFNGNDSFTFRTRDSGGETVDGTAAVTVNPVNDPPTSTSAAITTEEDVLSAGVTPTVVDIDSGESFTFSVLIQPSQGTAYALSSQLYYQSQQDYNGTDSFTYRAFDSGNASVDGTALVTITAVNDAPVADSQAVTTQEDTALPITLTGSDVEGDTLSFAIASQPAHGTLTGIPPDVTYLPATDYSGSDTFTFTVNDGTLDSAPGVVRITVTPAADIWFVDRDATGSADGRSWTNAFLHPQDALEISGAGDEIWVAEGIYELRTSTDTYVLTLVDGVVLYGGFGGTETSPTQRDITTHVTTLSGQDSSTVVYGAQGAHLDGFTITGGWLSGMVNEGVSPVVANCIFENNGLVQGQDGGAIRNVSGADASITNSVFISNYRSAIYNENSSPTIQDCEFYSNLSDSGGAIKNVGLSTQPHVNRCTFGGNTASINGGAISNASSAPLIENSIFLTNTAQGSGGAVANSAGASPTVVNSLFSNNSAGQSGGAFYSFESASAVINCTIADNSASALSGGVVSEKGHGGGVTIVNSILWNNTDAQVYDGPSSKTDVTYSDVQGGFKGTGNIALDPSFAAPASGDYRLGPTSPCLDTGDNTVVSTSLDLNGNMRIVDGDGNGSAVVDMGAYERPSP